MYVFPDFVRWGLLKKVLIRWRNFTPEIWVFKMAEKSFCIILMLFRPPSKTSTKNFHPKTFLKNVVKFDSSDLLLSYIHKQQFVSVSITLKRHHSLIQFYVFCIWLPSLSVVLKYYMNITICTFILVRRWIILSHKIYWHLKMKRWLRKVLCEGRKRYLKTAKRFVSHFKLNNIFSVYMFLVK